MRGLKRREAQLDLDDDWGSGLGDECEDFLTGHLVDTLHAVGVFAPVWSWVNEIAHGDADLVATAAARECDDDDVEARTRRTLARAVACATKHRALDALQHDVLVPLELSVAGGETTPRRLIELVGRALYL